MQRFAVIEPNWDAVPDDAIILQFGRLLEKHGLAPKLLAAVGARLTAKGLLLWQGTIVGATIIAAPSSTEKSRTARATRKCAKQKEANQWNFGMKAHIAWAGSLNWCTP